MRFSTSGWAATALVLATLAGCGSDDSGTPAPPPSNGSVVQAIAAAAANPANDTSTNSSSAFKVLQDAGVPAVVVAGPPKVNFTVFSDGGVVQGLTLADVSFIIAKLVPAGSDGIQQWISYTYRTEIPTPGVGPDGMPVLPSAQQATTDPKPPGQAGQLVYNADGYYTYTFSTDITDPDKTGGVVFEPSSTHRVAIQLSYRNRAGETIRVNPYFDIAFDGSGRSVQVTDPNKTRVMSDVKMCNGCHEKLALHGGGRVDVQYCVLCHSTATTDANSGNVLAMSTMTHKIHAGRLLSSLIGAGGENYVIWGFRDTKHDYAEVGFPQDLRNCSVCHSGADPATPQGDNWKTKASSEACLTCHVSGPETNFYVAHAAFTGESDPRTLPSSACQGCHVAGTALGSDRVHWVQIQANSAKYRMNIDGATYDPANRKVTVKYHLSDPTNNDAAYNLVTPDCVYPAPNVCTPPSGTPNNTTFGSLRLYIAYQNLAGQSTRVTEFTAYNNGGSAANAYMYLGSNDGSNRYSIDITLPPDTATAVAAGTARVISIGQVKELEQQAKSATEPRPPVSPPTYVNVGVQHAASDVVISGEMNPRRQVVSNEKCNVCHGLLGTTSGSNTVANAFHGGARNTVESCALCHDALRSSSTVMTNGTTLQESYQFKRMIHGIHGSTKRIYPFTHGNTEVGAFCNPRNPASVAPLCDPSLQLAEDVTNFAAEVAYPDRSLNCDNCHVNKSYMNDPAVVGAVVSPRASGADPLAYSVISPKAASCTGCHDSPQAIQHVTQAGNSAFGTRTLGQDWLVTETCVDCHAAGGFKAIDYVHGLQ
ncbi:MAG: OmcA/MtrC family decaheme c-type cytochrome [Burkholderiales bacterium]|nr:MAG: OmcA/MtrC family decaheme c-type cytochrome [Burkholderiales bacterium]